MIRNYHALACAVLGAALVLILMRGVEIYAFLVLAIAIPWDKLAHMTGALAEEYMTRGGEPVEKSDVENR